jgi:hypothetical protein
LDDDPVTGNQERGGNFLDFEGTGELTIQVEQKRELEMPVLARVEDGIVRRLREMR